ncbi:MAG: NosD domain-containing protein [Chloroflexota bacterium]
MFEQFSSWFSETTFQLYILLPVGLIGLWRWGTWLVRKLIGLRYKVTPTESFTATTSLVIPVYNENPEVFREALESWALEEPNEIIAVIDHSDKDCIAVFREFSQVFGGARMIITKKPGKRPALADGMRAATSEIVALVDSDTIWTIGVLPKLIAPFADPEVGGVGSRQNVLHPNTLAQKIFDIHLDSRYFDEIRFLAAAGNALTCLSGRTAVYRRSAVLPLLPDLENETFFGRPVISGDDKRLTHLVQGARWKVRYQEDARVFTPGAPKMGQFLKQRLRWTRNSWRADLRALYDGWVWREKALAFHLLDRIVQPITTLIAPIYFLLAIYRQNWNIVLVLSLWWLVSRAVKIFPHLRREPKDIVILPVYIVLTYVFALFKIFAFFTMNHQGWITRWDDSRMARKRKMRMVPAYSATFGMVFILGLSMFQVDKSHQERINDIRFFAVESELPAYDLTRVAEAVQQNPPPQVEVGATAVNEGTTSYTISDGDTPQLLAAKYGLPLSAINVNNTPWEKGQSIDIQLPFQPFETYRQGLDESNQANITYLPESNTIIISGFGSVTTVPQIRDAIDDKKILDYEGKGIYLLKANLYIDTHATVLVEGSDVAWLKLLSTPENFVAITSKGGNLTVAHTHISSWNPETSDYDTEHKDGRSYLLVRDARMDIIESEIGYLGYSLEVSTGGGGVYGLSWRIATKEQFGHELTTGSIINSKVHNNYFGIYTFGTTGMIMRGNEVFDNIQYGIDPHDDSNNFIVEENYVHDNGNHGIIFSKRCFNNIIRNNRSENNRLHGIMLDRNSNRNSVYGNILIGNTDGVAIWDSHRNDIYDNEIISNQRGVRLNREASLNVVHDNKIHSSTQYGFYLYDGASENTIHNNDLQRNDTGVYIKSEENFVIDNWISHSTQGVYLTEEAKRNQINANRIANNESGIYLKTLPDDYILNNTFLTNINNIRIAREWRRPVSDQIAATNPY